MCVMGWLKCVSGVLQGQGIVEWIVVLTEESSVLLSHLAIIRGPYLYDSFLFMCLSIDLVWIQFGLDPSVYI